MIVRIVRTADCECYCLSTKEAKSAALKAAQLCPKEIMAERETK